MKTRRSLPVLLALCLLAAGWVPVRAQSAGSRYFSESGHNVSGEFLSFYEGNLKALLVYGYPITEQFTGRDGKTVQYFQRARFEYHPELPEGAQVLLSPLGRETFLSSGAINVSAAMSCRTFPQTGFPVCFTFLEFFDKNGGLEQFGYPISTFEYHEDKIVQYFEKARLEWQPWRPQDQRVVVTDLGRIYFDQLGEDPALLSPVSPQDDTTSSILKLQVHAFTWKAAAHSSDTQKIFVIVQDQNLQPVNNSACTADVHWPDGRSLSALITTTPAGVGILSLNFEHQAHGSLILVHVSCSRQGLTSTTTTSFRIWH